jgi:virginiamycin B lyase
MKSLGGRMALAILLAAAACGAAFAATGGTISGTVKDSGGTPLPGAFVRAQNAARSKITVSVLSDRQGRYRFENLSPGSYQVWVSATGYKSDPAAAVKLAAGVPSSFHFALQKGMVRWSDLSNDQGSRLLPEGKGKQALFEQCFICHGFQSRMAATRRTQQGWVTAVNFMRSSMHFNLGLNFSDQEAADVAAYLNAMFGEGSKLPPSPADLPGYQETVRPFSDEALKIVYVDYDLPKPNSFPFSGAPDKDGKIWIPEFGRANRIARLDAATGELQEFTVPHQGTAAVHSAVPAADGAVWLAEQGSNKIGRWDPKTQTITEFPSPYQPGREGLLQGGSKHTLRVDPMGYVWSSGWPLNRLDPKTGKYTYYPEVRSAYSLTVDAEGSVWFCDYYSSTIGKADAKTGKLTKWPLPTAKSAPRRIEADRDGIIWIGEFLAGKIARFDPKTESFREYPLPGPDPTPYALAIDRHNQVWYSSHNMDVIGRLDPKTGRVTEYPIPYPENTMKEFFLDSQGRMWFGTPPNNKVGYFVLADGSGG